MTKSTKVISVSIWFSGLLSLKLFGPFPFLNFYLCFKCYCRRHRKEVFWIFFKDIWIHRTVFACIRCKTQFFFKLYVVILHTRIFRVVLESLSAVFWKFLICPNLYFPNQSTSFRYWKTQIQIVEKTVHFQKNLVHNLIFPNQPTSFRCNTQVQILEKLQIFSNQDSQKDKLNVVISHTRIFRDLGIFLKLLFSKINWVWIPFVNLLN